MKLSEYINTTFPNKKTAFDHLAKDLGCSRFTVKSWADGSRFPHRKWWAAIQTATDGSVTVADMADTGE